LAKFDMEADDGSRKEGWAHNRLQGLQGHSKITRSAQYISHDHFQNMAAFAGDNGDKVAEFDAVAKKVICSTECQNKARVARNDYRKLLGTELVRELILK
jgi:hypothetical protein